MIDFIIGMISMVVIFLVLMFIAEWIDQDNNWN
nr:MAG TPA_asm: hypothetical protein [Caudoviricetes sp.]